MPSQSGASLTANLLARISDNRWVHDQDLKQRRHAGHHNTAGSIWALVSLSFQTLGVVYGDIGTSPLYVMSGIFEKHSEKHDVLGAVSLVIWTVTMLVVVKYALLVLRADDNGNGGAFALFSLLKRATNISYDTQGGELASDYTLTRYSVGPSAPSQDWRTKVGKTWILRKVLQLMVVIGVGFILGDGVMTPAISVLSAAEGLAVNNEKVTQSMVVSFTIAVLVFLFSIQRYGTQRVSGVFAPVIALWLLTNAGVGAYNIATYNPQVVRAISPFYFVDMFRRQPYKTWKKLSGVLLCVTGTEALFADLGHFSRASIQLSCMTFVYPALLLTYLGQAAYLCSFPHDVSDVFWKSLPAPLFTPMLVTATLATTTASQSLISAVFSIVSQAISQGCFPKFKVVHTSKTVQGQVYIPMVNYIMMTLTIVVVSVYRKSEALGHAYGIAVICDMLITTLFMTLILLLVWRRSILVSATFLLVFGTIEGGFLSASLQKIPEGGWFSLMMAAIWGFIMWTWNWGSYKKTKHTTNNVRRLRDLIHQEVEVIPDGSVVEVLRLVDTGERVHRFDGLGLYYSEAVSGVPPALTDFITKVPSLPRIVVFVTNRRIDMPEVLPSERLLIGPLSYTGFYHCVARYGYMEQITQGSAFASLLMSHLTDLLLQSRDTLLGLTGSPRAGHISNGEDLVVLQVDSPEASEAADSYSPPSDSPPPLHLAASSSSAPTHPPSTLATALATSPRPAHRSRLADTTTAGGRASSSFQRTSIFRSYSDAFQLDDYPFLLDKPSLPFTRVDMIPRDTLSEEQVQVIQLRAVDNEIRQVTQQLSKRCIYVFGKTLVKARPQSNVLRWFMLEYPYTLLVNNFSVHPYDLFNVPLENVVEATQVYYL